MVLKVYVFPGQGSQRKGMGEGLFDQFADYTRRADDVLGYSIERLCLEDPDNQLGQTQFTQPALYVVEALSYLSKLDADPAAPDYLAGHSLGEYVALYAAGAFEFDVGLQIVKRRGELMSQATGGAMAAVIGCGVADIGRVLADNGLDDIDIANYNSPTQTVISGPQRSIEACRSSFKEHGARVIPLPVSAAFHSRYMRSASAEFGEFLKGFDYRPLRIPVISNLNARPYADGDIVPNLRDQICGSVQWTDTIRYLMGRGDFEFEEIGPGSVLTKLITTIRRDAEPLVGR